MKSSYAKLLYPPTPPSITNPLHEFIFSKSPKTSTNTPQKASKTLAASNTARLNQTLYLTLAFHLLFWLLRAALHHRTFTRYSLLYYLLFASPQLAIQFLFERQSRPSTSASGTFRAGEDLDAKGLTEYMWDVVYWTYGCLVVVSLVGDWGWWAWAVVPAYAGWSAWTTWRGFQGAYTDSAGVPQPEAASKRQEKREKRGDRKVQYR
jgi:hypothetical protein